MRRNTAESKCSSEFPDWFPAALEPKVDGITNNSSEVRPGYLFVAVRGLGADGHDFISEAVNNGAVAVIGERKGIAPGGSVPYVQVESSRKALAELAEAFHGFPSKRLKLVGITGTNGKTSTAHLLRSVFRAARKRACLFGTLAYEIDDKEWPARETTPGALDLSEMIGRAVEAECEYGVIEVSSHALDQDRAWAITLEGAVFTNITQDHLDYHATFEEYRDAKLRLFSGRKHGTGPRFAVLNADDPHVALFAEKTSAEVITYGMEQPADIHATDMSSSQEGSRVSIEGQFGRAELFTSLVGRHNIYNVLAAAGSALLLDFDMDAISQGIAEPQVVPGRFEWINEGQEFGVVVDYAHTDDGLRNLLLAARPLCANRLMVVFGCGGDRDRGKRPKMGSVAAELADVTFLTSDNPRSEDPLAIIIEAESGILRKGKKKGLEYFVEPDREGAIHAALEMARIGDLVLIAGKGHETYQIIGDRRLDFDDRAVARAILREL